jgi:hypothetical protein
MATLRMKDFTIGTPIELAFRTLDPKTAPDNGYGPAMVFTSDAGSVYLDLDSAREVIDGLREQGIRPGQPCRITRVKTSHGGSRFDVARIGDSGGHNVPERSDAYEAPRGALTLNGGTQRGVAMVQQPAAHVVTPASATLCACLMASIDAFEEAGAYAGRKYQTTYDFNAEDVRAFAISLFINGGVK